jgi:hypothetical protein
MDPTLARFAHSQYGVFTATQAEASGLSRDEVARAVRTGHFVRLHRGIYARAEWFAHQPAEIKHLALARGVQLQMNVPVAWSHRTAAIAHGLPLLGTIPEKPEVTVERGARRTATGATLHTAAMKEGHIDVVRGARVTSIARTICDVARQQGTLAGVISGDAALHNGLIAASDFDVVLRDCRMWKRIPRFKRALELLDPLTESPGESISRCKMHEHGIERPEVQAELAVEGRTYRPDFAWRWAKVLGEFDGRVKYGAAEDLFAEKQREDALRRAGWTVVRWTWDDLWTKPEPAFIVRLRRALTTAAA